MAEDIQRYYDILGLKPSATAEEIKEAYRDLATVWHPDRFPRDSRLRYKAQQRLKEINVAYEALSRLQPAAATAAAPKKAAYRGQPRPQPNGAAVDASGEQSVPAIPWILAALIVVAVLIVVVVVVGAVMQLTSSPVPVSAIMAWLFEAL